MARDRRQVLAIAIGVIVPVLAVAYWLALPRYLQNDETMSPTIGRGDMVVIARGRTIRRNDLIAFHARDKDTVYMTRVIGVAGDNVQLHDGHVELNGKALDEPYAGENTANTYWPVGRMKVAPDHFLVMTDNHGPGMSSRQWSSIGRDQVVGRAVFLVSGTRGFVLLR